MSTATSPAETVRACSAPRPGENRSNAKRTIGLAVVGLGGRSQGMVAKLLEVGRGRVRVVAGFDPNPETARTAFAGWGAERARAAPSAEDAANADGVDWVMVFSPNARHKEGILAGFDAGRHVFSEKPLATTVADCEAIYRAHRAHPKLHFATGFVLRYSPLYRKVKELLDSGAFGRIVSVDATENIEPELGGYMKCGWRRFVALSGPHILEKCCHDLDLLNWFMGDLPTRAAAFGGNRMFVPENEPLMAKYGPDTFYCMSDPDRAPSPFLSGGEVMDHQVNLLRYRGGATAQFQTTMANAMPERRMYFSCTEGSIALDLYRCSLRWRRLGEEAESHMLFDKQHHGGGDYGLVGDLLESMLHDAPPKCSADEGLESAVAALALDEAAREERVVDLEPVWAALER